ncbi:MAG: DUF262 domain-containing HNH endonuclease family protein [Cyanobacteria bacterium P01_D01_bin.116]
MDKNLNSLSKIFTEKLYRIPDYQRGYAWTADKQLKDFWGDLEQLEKGKNHYLGVLTLEEVTDDIVGQWKDDHWIVESKSYEPYYIVDGQQRLTTAIILIQAILDCIDKKERLNYTTWYEIRKKFIFDSKNEGISRSYIFGYEKDNPSYEFLKTKIFGEQSELSANIQETIYTHNLEKAKAFFIGKISPLSIKETEDIYHKLTQNLLFNIYSISSEIDVFVAFETMNNRGKPLSHLELLKNRLIYLSTKFFVEEYEKDRLRNCINESWKSIYHSLGRNKDNPLEDDQFLFYHFITYFDFANSVDDEDDKISTNNKKLKIRRYLRGYYKKYLLEEKFTTKNIFIENDSSNNFSNKERASLTVREIYDYVRNLKVSVELWYKIANPQDSDFTEDEKLWLDKLNRIEKKYKQFFSSSAPLVMIFFQKENDSSKRIKFLKALECLQFFSLFYSYGYTYYLYLEKEQIDFIELAANLSQGLTNTEKIIRQLEELRSHIVNDKELLKRIKAEFKSKGFYKWRGINYFLFEYELSLQIQSKTNRKKINWEEFTEDYDYDYKTIEHIYPQKPRRNCWTSKYQHYSQKERSILKNSLGNLLPLSKPRNSSFSNKCFVDKVSGDGNNKIGYKYGSYSENEITEYKDWTAKEILERGIKFLEFMEKRWNFTIGNRKQKIDFLNLIFVSEKES